MATRSAYCGTRATFHFTGRTPRVLAKGGLPCPQPDCFANLGDNAGSQPPPSARRADRR